MNGKDFYQVYEEKWSHSVSFIYATSMKKNVSIFGARGQDNINSN